MSLVAIAAYDNSFEAGDAQARLEAADIASFLFDANMGLLFGSGIRLMVDDEDETRAREVLSAPGA
jgi:hypothetical protein